MSNTEDTKEKGMQPQDSENCSPMAGYKTSLSSSVVLRQTQPLVPTFSRLVQASNNFSAKIILLNVLPFIVFIDIIGVA